MYVFVLLQPGENEDPERLLGPAHVEFIDSLIERNAVLLGGDFSGLVENAHAAYLLRCGDLDEAERIVAADPFVINDLARPKLVEWQLVAVNPDAVDADDIVHPAHGGR
jgi:uncharacterized protein YciI